MTVPFLRTASCRPPRPLFDIQPMKAGLADSLAGYGFLMRLFGIFAGVALRLAAVGIYGSA